MSGVPASQDAVGLQDFGKNLTAYSEGMEFYRCILSNVNAIMKELVFGLSQL